MKINSTLNESYLLTSESVTEGHPDKLCDRIADSILDALISQDPESKVAVEVAISNQLVVLLGEVTSKAVVEFEEIAKKVLHEIGYKDKETGFDLNSCQIISNINPQSTDIGTSVHNALEYRNNKQEIDEFNQQGAGDQGIVFGFACNETNEYMPMPIYLAHKLTKRLAQTRHENEGGFLLPDGKAQVTVEYKNNKPFAINNIIVSSQHKEQVSTEQLKDYITEQVIQKSMPDILLNNSSSMLVHINPSGRFVIGGPLGDAGLTGRKIVVDTYGGNAKHGGGAFSGKDPSKVDRTGAYMSRYIAKNLVAAGIADKIEIQIAYGIGIANPIAINFDCFGTNKVELNLIHEIINKVFDCRPGAIIKQFNLKRPIYSQLSSYGHFGRNDLELPWENLDKIDEIKKIV